MRGEGRRREMGNGWEKGKESGEVLRAVNKEGKAEEVEC